MGKIFQYPTLYIFYINFLKKKMLKIAIAAFPFYKEINFSGNLIWQNLKVEPKTHLNPPKFLPSRYTGIP